MLYASIWTGLSTHHTIGIQENRKGEAVIVTAGSQLAHPYWWDYDASDLQFGDGNLGFGRSAQWSLNKEGEGYAYRST